MASQIIEVPGQGRIEFPAEMNDADIVAAIRDLSAPAPTPKPMGINESGTAKALSTGGDNGIAGIGENALSMLTGAAGQVAGGYAGIAQGVKNLFSEGMPAGDRAAQVQGAMTYEPRTESGKNIAGVLDSALGWFPRGAERIGEVVSNATTPAIGAGVNAAIQAAPALLGFPEVRGPLSTGTRVAASSVKGAIGSLAQQGIGLTTGAGAEALNQAYKAGKSGDKSFSANMRGNVPIDEVLADAKRGLQNIQTANSASYKTAKTGWASDTTKLDFSPIDKAFSDLENSLNVNGHSLIGKAERSRIDEVKSVLDEWRADPSSHTTLGLDALKRRIDTIYPDNYSQSQAQRVITGTRNAVKDAIVKQAPDYADAMKSYETQLGTIRDIEKGLSLGDKVSKDTAIKKLQSITNDSGKFRKTLAESLKAEGGVDIVPAVSGQALSGIAPKGLARINPGAIGYGALSNPTILAALPFTSPRLMGELFHGAGQFSGVLSRAVSEPKLPPAALSIVNDGSKIPSSSPPALSPDQIPTSLLDIAPSYQKGGPTPAPSTIDFPLRPSLGPLYNPRLSLPQRGALSIADAPNYHKMPEVQFGSTPEPRPTLSLAEPPVPSRPSVTGSSIDFPLRQEVLQQPAISNAIDAFRTEAARLQGVIDNPKASVKHRADAQNQLTALKEEFGAGMRQLGIDNPQDAIGIQRLYSSGKGTKLPITKTDKK